MSSPRAIVLDARNQTRFECGAALLALLAFPSAPDREHAEIAASICASHPLADLQRRYGYFLDFLDRSCLLDDSAPAAGQVNPENVGKYIEELSVRVGSVTTYGSIYKLRRASQLLGPTGDFGWLIELEKDLALVMRPRSKADRLVLTEVLVEAGLTLMTEAESSTSLTHRERLVSFVMA